MYEFEPGVTISHDNASTYSHEDISWINNMVKEIYAREVWRYKYCDPCGIFYKKRDIFSVLDKNEQKKSISELEWKYPELGKSCTTCATTLTELHPSSIQNWMAVSDEVRIICMKQQWRVIGVLNTAEVSIEDMFALELSSHYRRSVLDIIKKGLWWKEKVCLYTCIGMSPEATTQERLLALFYEWSDYQLEHKSKNRVPAFAEMNERSLFYKFCYDNFRFTPYQISQEHKKIDITPPGYESILVTSMDMPEVIDQIRVRNSWFWWLTAGQ